jgi:hypothetical protein
MQITNEDIAGILKYVNKTDTNKLEVSIMGDRDTLRKTYILTRGVYDAPAKEVEPSTPPSILPYPADLPRNRLGLSQWLFDPRHPLTARVFVNRMWQEFFAKGIVKSPDDFGSQGQLPTNPELLDWLAVDFREHGWDIKRLVKQIMMSATYRQSAVISKEKLEQDKDDIYLSYAPRVRLQAELVRDVILKSSGLLNTKIGGTSVKPYQPAGLWEMATSGRGILATYRQDHGSLLYRRGMYTFIKRTVPPPGMMIFDASNRDQCEVKRTRTNTPLQALVMMNDPTVLEASLALADTLLKNNTAPDATVINGFRRIICRKPDKKETDLLVNYWKDQQAYFKSHPDAAEQLIKVGEYKPDGKNAAGELAAMMQVLQVIYNMEEAITKT